MNTSILFTMLGVLAILGGLTLFCRKKVNTKRCSKKAVGTVSGITKVTKGEGSADYYSPVLSFLVDGKTQTFQSPAITFNPNEYKEGDRYSIYYNPSNPEEYILSEKIVFYKKPLALLLMVLGVVFFVLSVSLDSDAFEGNVYTKDFSYTNPSTGKTTGATLEIRSSSETDWNLRIDEQSDANENGHVSYRLSADGKPGDVISATITSEYEETYLGLTFMPKRDGKWQKGSQFTTFVKDGSPDTLKNEYIITPDDSDLQVSFAAYSNMFAAKSPGSVSIVFTVEMNGHHEVTRSNSNLGSLLLTIFCGAMFLIILAGILSKINAHKQKKKQ